MTRVETGCKLQIPSYFLFEKARGKASNKGINKRQGCNLQLWNVARILGIGEGFGKKGT